MENQKGDNDLQYIDHRNVPFQALDRHSVRTHPAPSHEPPRLMVNDCTHHVSSFGGLSGTI